MSEHAIREYLKTIGSGGGVSQEIDPVFTASPAYGISAQDIADWNDKQDELVSGTNIKTINNTSLLGSGDITVAAGGTSVPTADEVSEFDSDAHINSTDMTTGSGSELEDFIDGLNVSGGADSNGTKTYNTNNGTVRVDWYKTLRVVYVVLTIRPSSAWATGSGNRITCTLDSDIPLPTDFVSGAEINGIACMILNGTSFRAQNNTGSSLAKDSNYNISLTYFT